MKAILKISLVVGALFALLGVSAFAASITSLSGNDGTNAFPTTSVGLTAETPLDTTITLNGMTDTAEANISIKISTAGTIVYVNQIVSKADKSFSISFPVSLEAGRTYEIAMNIEDSTHDPRTLYFMTAPMRYGDLTGDKKINSSDLTQLLRYVTGKGYSATAAAAVAEGKGEITGDGRTNTSDLTQLLRYLSNYNTSNTVKTRLSWYVKP